MIPMNLSMNFLKKHYLKISAVIGAVVVIAVAVHVISHFGTNRRTFVFPVSGSRWNKTEVRYLTSDPVQGKIQCYVDELILGPSFYRGRPLFTLGTRVEYCFLRNKTLYVGLSEEASLQENGAPSVVEGTALFKKNIKRNFTGIKYIELFIDGNFIGD